MSRGGCISDSEGSISLFYGLTSMHNCPLDEQVGLGMMCFEILVWREAIMLGLVVVISLARLCIQSGQETSLFGHSLLRSSER